MRLNHSIRRLFRGLLLANLFAALTVPALADNRFIVRDQLGASALQGTCLVVGCSVVGTLDGSLGQLFLVTTSSSVNPTTFLTLLLGQFGVVDAEVDQLARLRQSSSAG